MNLKKIRISELTPDVQNANKGTERGRKALEESLQKYGFGRSLLLDKHGNIIAGNKTHEVAGAIGLDEVLVVQVDGNQVVAVQRTDLDLNDPRAKELAIADNRVAQLDLEWDAEILQELEKEGVDIGLFWKDEELDALLAQFQADEPEEPDEQPGENVADANAIAPREGMEPGSVWQLGRHRMMCGDCTVEENIRKLLGSDFGNVGMVWADPPYGIKAQNKSGQVGGDKGAFGKKKTVKGNRYPIIANDNNPETATQAFQFLSHLFRDSVHIWWGANNYPSVLPFSSGWIVWDKKEGDADGMDFADAELAYTNSKTAIRVFRHHWIGLWKASENGEARVHPTQKPIALCEWAFEKYGADGDIIIDPFLGSAPSIIAAQKMDGDRTVYGFELMPEYGEVILRRWEEFVGSPAKRVE